MAISLRGTLSLAGRDVEDAGTTAAGPAVRGEQPALSAGGPVTGWTDAEVIRASLTHGEWFGEIFRRHGSWVLGYVGRRLGPELAEDVMADTFAVAFRIRERFDQARDTSRPWLMGIASREISHRRRAERSRYRTLAALPPEPPVDDIADRIAASATAAALRGPVAAGLAALKAPDRDVLLLVAWADLSYGEVAEALGVPVGTVRSRLNRARRVIRDALAVLEETGEDGLSWTN